MNPFIQELIGAITSLLTTGKATITLPAQNFEIGGEKFSVDETVTLTKS